MSNHPSNLDNNHGYPQHYSYMPHMNNPYAMIPPQNMQQPPNFMVQQPPSFIPCFQGPNMNSFQHGMHPQHQQIPPGYMVNGQVYHPHAHPPLPPVPHQQQQLHFPPQHFYQPNGPMNGGHSAVSSNSTPTSASSHTSSPRTSTTSTTPAPAHPVAKPKHKYNIKKVETFRPNKSHEEHLENAQKKLESVPSPSFNSPLISTQILHSPYAVTPPVTYGNPQQSHNHDNNPYATQHINAPPPSNDFNDNNDNDQAKCSEDKNSEKTTQSPSPSEIESEQEQENKQPQDKEEEEVLEVANKDEFEIVSLPVVIQDVDIKDLALAFGTTFEKLNGQLQRFRELEREQDLLNNEDEGDKSLYLEDEEKDKTVGKPTLTFVESEETKTSAPISPSPVSIAPVPPAMNWSSMAQSAAAIKPKVVPSSSSSAVKSQVSVPVSAKPQPVFVPSVSNALEPLGAVTLKYVYDKSFKNKALISQLPKVIPRGLVNTGNICFMSSILQLLLHCEPFYQSMHLIANKTIGSMTIKDSKSPLFDALLEFFKEFAQKNEGKEVGENITPSDIYTAITAHNNFQHLQWGQQEDAEEFFGYLLDGLNEEFTESVKNLNDPEIKALLNSILNDETRNSIKASIKKFNSPEFKLNDDETTTSTTTTIVGEDGWQEVNKSKKIVSSSRREVEIKPSPINHLFGGQFRSVLKVPNEKHTQSITLDPFLQIQLDISDVEITSLTEAFKRVSTIEELQYKGDSGKDVIATKQTFIDRLPNVLIIHLKRFSFTAKTSRYGRIEKIRKVIDYKEKLSVPADCLSQAIRSAPADYKLIGVVYHHGLNSDGGHYTVDVLQNGTGTKWIRIDDTNITTLTLEDVLPNTNAEESKTAYILMYQKISS